MAVANDTIIQKMMKELTQAQNKAADNNEMKNHIANVQLLCELLLEEKPTSIDNDISKEEMMAMIGDNDASQKKKAVRQDLLDEDDANGKSIFDF